MGELIQSMMDEDFISLQKLMQVRIVSVTKNTNTESALSGAKLEI